MAPDKDDQLLGSIRKKLNRSAKNEEAQAKKRAEKLAKKVAPGRLNAEEESTANNVRAMLANISGYNYNPDYQYNHLRTEPPCKHPEYSEYTKKQMKEKKAEERKKKLEANGTDGVTDRTSSSSFATSSSDEAEGDRSEPPSIRVEDTAGAVNKDDVAPTTEEVDKLAASFMPNIARLSLMDDSDDEDEDDEDGPIPTSDLLLPRKTVKRSISTHSKASASSDATVTRLGGMKSSDAASIKTTRSEVTVIHHEGTTQPVASPLGSKLVPKAGENATTKAQTPSPVKFVRPPHPVDYENPSLPGTPTPASHSAISEASQHNQTVEEMLHEVIRPCGDIFGDIDLSDLVHPWPELWSKPNGDPLSDSEWKIVHGCLGFLGMPEFGTIEPSDPCNRDAYDQVRNLLKMSWMLMTGQLTPSGNEVASQILKPMLEKEGRKKDAELRRLDELLRLRRKELKLPPVAASKRSSGSYGVKSVPPSPMPMELVGTPLPAFTDYFNNSPISPNASKHSSFGSSHGQPPSVERSSWGSNNNQALQPSSARSSYHSSFDNHPGSQTPSKRNRVMSFGNLFKNPKSPKRAKSPGPSKSPKSPGKRGSAEEESLIATTPLDAPPVPPIPATFSGQNTPHMSFDGSFFSNRSTPLVIGSQSVTKRDSSSSAGDTTSAESGREPRLAIFGTPQRGQMPDKGLQSASFSGTPVMPDMNAFSPRVATPTTLSANTSFCSANDSAADMRARTHSHSLSANTVDFNIFDAHMEEFVDVFRTWDNGEDIEESGADKRVFKFKTMQFLPKEERRNLKKEVINKQIDEITSLRRHDFSEHVEKEALKAKYPITTSGIHAKAFPLPLLALRLAQHLLDHINKSFLPQLDCAYELGNAANIARERVWRFRNPNDPHYPGPGIPRPTSDDYLHAGYMAAWATRFVQWAQEQEQLWQYNNIDVPDVANVRGGGGVKRQGRTIEVRNLMNWTDEKVDVDNKTGEIKIEGDGAVIPMEEVSDRFEKLAAREEENGMMKKWGACEDQVRRLASVMAPSRVAGFRFGASESRVDVDMPSPTSDRRGALSRAGLAMG
ncbi:hypothetical protein GTA08_BOTSDO08881 [Neofusicoccum parvum]|uniref:Uncharacterized protein n=1 Tax=Neofusicoccum parvum TaxID=310453 RepID=A0ACB5RQZ9_9PEZI|nr:hypothetical protein GTA08_BOTSDO08881 [Neofusicoccum parvum]